MNRFDDGRGLGGLCAQLNSAGDVWSALKEPCKAATTANIALTGRQTIDGVTLLDGARVLVKDQTFGQENGIYLHNSNGIWPRALDWADDAEVIEGTVVHVQQGTTQAGQDFRVTTSGDITVGVTSVALAAAYSSASSSFTQSGSGAVSRTMQGKARDIVSALDFVPVALVSSIQDRSNTTDLKTYLQSAIDALGDYGGVLLLPTGEYLIQSGLSITKNVSIRGYGHFSSIRPGSSFLGASNNITVTPSTSYALDRLTFADFHIGYVNDGTRAGNHAIFLDTQVAGAYLPKFTMRNVGVGSGTGRSVYHLNNTTNNINGGLYCALIENCQLVGSVYLDGSGDSNVIRTNIISGSGVGVYANLAAGASLLTIEDNNITSTGGAVKIDGGNRPQIRRNNCEQTTTGASNDSMIDIAGGGSTMYGGVIEGNHLGAFTGSGIVQLIRLNNINGVSVRDNVFVAGDAGMIGTKIVSGVSTRIGANTYNANITEANKVSDSGTGTCGVVKDITLGNSWVENGSTYDQATFFKDCEGIVHLCGTIKDGTATAGTTLFTLPTGFRPPQIGRYPVVSLGGGGYELAHVQVYDTGEVTIEDGANTLFTLSGVSFRASGGADGATTE